MEEKHVAALFDCGDKRLNQMCIGSIRKLRSTRRSTLICGSLASNLQVLHIQEEDNFYQPCLTSDMLSRFIMTSHLLELAVYSLSTQWQMALPPTLTKLLIGDIYHDATTNPSKFLQLGDAKLVHFGFRGIVYDPMFDCSGDEYSDGADAMLASLEHDYAIDKLINNVIVQPSAYTLTRLDWPQEDTIPLKLSKMTHLLDLQMHSCQVTQHADQFEASPNLESLNLSGELEIHNSVVMCDIANLLPSTMTFLNLKNVYTHNEWRLDISMYPHLQVLRINVSISDICCAPANQLTICSFTSPVRLQNLGTGMLRLDCQTIEITDAGIDGGVLNAMCWESLHSLVLLCTPEPYKNVTSQMWSSLARATNIVSISIERDVLDFFVARGGNDFFLPFKKLTSLDWSMDQNLCISLNDTKFVVPSTVQSLVIDIVDATFPSIFDKDSRLLDCLSHTPDFLSLDGFPLSNKILDICNTATSPLEFMFNWYSGMIPNEEGVDLRSISQFAPSSNLVSANFDFGSLRYPKTLKLLHHIFGSHLDDRYYRVVYPKAQISKS